MSQNAIRMLTDRFWIIKDQEKELYYQAREGLDAARKFARDYPGWRLVNNERVLKLEKIPSHAQPFMGITDFSDRIDYVLFCALLVFLEDKEDEEPFLLSELIDMMEAQLKSVMTVDWTLFTMRRSLVRVMQFAQKQGLLLLHEGNMEAVSQDIRQEVLYENTGLSRFFAVNFPYDTSEYHSWQDYEEEHLSEADTDRGQFRIQRVYRSLISQPAMYWDQTDDPDSRYLKNQRQWVSKYLEENLEGRLDIHRNAAFFVLEDENTYGDVFPGSAMINDIVLLVCGACRAYLAENATEAGSGETYRLSKELLQSLISKCIEKFSPGWSKEFREMEPDKLFSQVIGFMESWMMLKQENESFLIYPGTLKFAGRYPKDFDPEALKEQALSGRDQKENIKDGTEPAGMEKKTRSSGTRKKKKKAEQNADSEGQLSLFSL